MALHRGMTVLLFLSLLMGGCTPGTYTKKHSTAPALGPIMAGLSRAEVEDYLGKPLTTIPIDKQAYTNLYTYEKEMGVGETRSLDFLNIITLCLGDYVVTPMDRYSGTKHLVAITYVAAQGIERELDRVVEISTDVDAEPFGMAGIGDQEKGGVPWHHVTTE